MSRNQHTEQYQHRMVRRHQRTIAYTGGAEDQRAAGNVTVVDYCRCGAERHTHCNQGHSERTQWAHQ